MPRIFHLLPDSEPQTHNFDSSVINWVSHVLESDDGAVVVTPAKDDIATFHSSNVRLVAGLSAYRAFHTHIGHLLPTCILARSLARLLIRPLLDIEAGDSVWIHDRPEFALALGPFLRKRGVRIFLHFHNTDFRHYPKRMMKNLQVDCIVFKSHALQQEALERFANLGTTQVLDYGLNVQDFHPRARRLASNASLAVASVLTSVVFSAEDATIASLQVFLDAMSLLQARQVHVRGMIVGSCGASLAQLQLPTNVSFTTGVSQTELGRIFRESDVFCTPALRHRNMTLPLSQAMACGLPVILLGQRGNRAGSADTRGVIQISHSSDTLAEAIQSLAEDSQRRSQLAAMAYETYTSSFLWSSLRSSYKSVLASPASPRTEFQLSPSLNDAFLAPSWTSHSS